MSVYASKGFFHAASSSLLSALEGDITLADEAKASAQLVCTGAIRKTWNAYY
jgi:hypothetical protein